MYIAKYGKLAGVVAELNSVAASGNAGKCLTPVFWAFLGVFGLVWKEIPGKLQKNHKAGRLLVVF